MSRVCAHVVEDGATFCKICGTTQTQIAAGYGCIWRDVADARHGGLRPEPALHKSAVEDADVITARIAQIRADETPKCPVNPGKTLYDCLRSSTKCGGTCQHIDAWIGPQ